jgi:hypothetical protein
LTVTFFKDNSRAARQLAVAFPVHDLADRHSDISQQPEEDAKRPPWLRRE